MVRGLFDAGLPRPTDLTFPLRPPSSASRQLAAADCQAVLIGLLRASDLVVAVAGAVAAYAFRFTTGDLADEYWAFTLLGAVLLVNYLELMRAYEFKAIRRLRGLMGTTLACWFAVLLTLISVAYFIKLSEDFSRIWVAIWFCTTSGMLVTTRLVGAEFVARWQRSGRLTRRLAIIGPRKLVERLARRVSSFDGIEVTSRIIVDRVRMRGHGARQALAGPRDVAALLSLVRASQIDEIILAPGPLPDPSLHELLRALRTLAVEVRLYATGLEQPLPTGQLSVLFGLPLFSIVERPLTGWTQIVKRAEDVLISGLALLFVLPVMGVIAIAIKLDSRGPVLFRQDRLGFNSNLIRIYKFRSMYHRPDAEPTAEQARHHDPRVTRIGRLLRRTSLDELPQLFNVLRGDMSLVGPRPHPTALNQKFADVIDGYLARHRVKPGITGWAQVNGLRGETDTVEKMQRRVEHDLYYIDNWSLLFDLKILLFTAFVGFVHENAY